MVDAEFSCHFLEQLIQEMRPSVAHQDLRILGALNIFLIFKFEFSVCSKRGIEVLGNGMLHVMWDPFMKGAFNGTPSGAQNIFFFSGLNSVYLQNQGLKCLGMASYMSCGLLSWEMPLTTSP